jgi:hypothetical protein
MPQYKSVCKNCNKSFEWYSACMTLSDPPCPDCGGTTARGYFPLANIWSKPLVAYGDPKKESFHKDEALGGHVVFERDSDQAKSEGKPIRRVIRTIEDQKRYCKAEGLLNPRDIPNNLTVGADGKSYEKNNISEV